VLILRGIRGRGRLNGLSAIPVHRRASTECGAVFPGAPCASLRPRGGMWRVSWAMKSNAEKCFSLPLKYPEAQDFQVIVSCCSSQWIFSSESGGRTVYWLNACRASWS
jgi:hypothetical protein